MARGKALDHGQTRLDLLNKAAQLFARHGYVGSSMSMIAQHCGVSKALLYHYYEDKEQLLYDIAVQYVQGLLRITHTSLQTHTHEAAEQRLRTLIVALMDHYRTAQAQHMVLTNEVKFLSRPRHQEVLQAQREVVQVVTQLITQLAPALQAQRIERAVAMMLFGMINWTFTWLDPAGELSHEDYGHMVATAFTAGVRALAQDLP